MSFPGVPPLLNTGGFAAQATSGPVLLVADALLVTSIFSGPKWGIFDNSGNPVVTGDSVRGVSFRKDRKNSTFPVEEGGFDTYNKVAIPYVLKMTFMKGAIASIASTFGLPSAGSIPGFTQGDSISDRGAFLNQIDLLMDSTDTFHAVTPEVTYVNANPTHYDYDRAGPEGATLLAVNVWLEEIRQTAQTTFSNAQQPAGANPANGGIVQGQTTSFNVPAPM